MRRLHKLNGWQRLWVALSCAALVYALGWGFVQGASGGGERVRADVVTAFGNPLCRPALEMPAQSKLSAEPDGDGPCWELYLYRSIYENASVTADGYVKDIEARRRDWMLSSVGIAIAIWAIAATLSYGIGWVIAWVRRGFASSDAKQ